MANNGRNYTKGGKKPRGRRGSSPRSKEVEVNVRDDQLNDADLSSKSYKSGQNDPAWYANNAALLRDSSSFPYSLPIGTQIYNTGDIHSNGYTGGSDVINPTSLFQSVPGVMIMGYEMVIGGSDNSPTSPFNLASMKLFSDIRSKQSGRVNYDSPDLAMYILAMDSAYSLYSELVRVYGLMRHYTILNRYTPATVVKQLGFDYDDLSRNLAQLRYVINSFADKLGSMCVPAGLTFVTRHAWLNSNIFVDSGTMKAQMYMWAPDHYYSFSPKSTEQAANSLVPTVAPHTHAYEGTEMSVVQISNLCNRLIEQIRGNQDFAIMSGDILKAYGPGNLFTIAPIAEDYTITPIFSQEILTQIENARFVGRIPSGALEIKQVTSESTITYSPYLVQELKWEFEEAESIPNGFEIVTPHTEWNKVLLINMHTSEVLPADTMVATRMTPWCSLTSSNAQKFIKVDVCGSEIPTSINLVELLYEIGNFATASNVKDSDKLYCTTSLSLGTTTQVDELAAGLLMLRRISAFDWHPIIDLFFFGNVFGTPSAYTYLGPVCDIDNYTLMGKSDLAPMHETALLSEFTIPNVIG
nr:putative capsid [Marmot picobirnavirus]